MKYEIKATRTGFAIACTTEPSEGLTGLAGAIKMTQYVKYKDGLTRKFPTRELAQSHIDKLTSASCVVLATTKERM